MPKATVIISVYNRLDFLKLVLAGFERQTFKDYEIIVSDDGSGKEFVDGLTQIIADSPLAIRHNWHADEGFKKNIILNSSIQKARSPYLIFVDGDCIPHREFVAEHLANASKGVCLNGRRVDMSPQITQTLTVDGVKRGELESSGMQMRMMLDFLRSRLFRLKNGWYIRNKRLRAFINRKDRGILGANFSLHKEDLLAINGFDERYTAPTFGEDTDIEYRLRLNGVRFKPVLNIAIVYHCWHKLLPRPELSKALYEQVVKEGKAYTQYGIVKDMG